MRRRAKLKRDKGIALIMALIILAVLSLLTAGLILATQTEIWTTSNYRTGIQARYAAEAGAQSAANWISHSYAVTPALTALPLNSSPVMYNGAPVVLSGNSSVPSNYPDNTVQSAFSDALSNKSLAAQGVTANYSATATLLSMKPMGGSYVQNWQITAQGSVPSVKSAQVQVVETIEQSSTSLFTYGVFATSSGCNSLHIDGNTTTDSYDSSAGNYASTQQNTMGNLGTNGNMGGDSGIVVNGVLATPHAPVAGGNCAQVALTNMAASGIRSGIQRISPRNIPVPTMPVQPAGNSTTTSNIAGGNVTLPPGTYGNIKHPVGGTIHLQAGTYNLNSFSSGDPTTIVIDSGPVIWNIWGTNVGSMVQTGKLTANLNGIPSNFQINSASSSTIRTGDAISITALIDAPNAAVSFGNSGSYFGALISSTYSPTSNVAIHYDRSLMNGGGTVGDYHVTSFNWSRF